MFLVKLSQPPKMCGVFPLFSLNIKPEPHSGIALWGRRRCLFIRDYKQPDDEYYKLFHLPETDLKRYTKIHQLKCKYITNRDDHRLPSDLKDGPFTRPNYKKFYKKLRGLVPEIKESNFLGWFGREVFSKIGDTQDEFAVLNPAYKEAKLVYLNTERADGYFSWRKTHNKYYHLKKENTFCILTRRGRFTKYGEFKLIKEKTSSWMRCPTGEVHYGRM